MEIQEAERSGRLVIEAKNVTFGYDGRRRATSRSSAIFPR